MSARVAVVLLLVALASGCPSGPAPSPGRAPSAGPPRAGSPLALRASCVAAGARFGSREESAASFRRHVEETGLFSEVVGPYSANKKGDVQLNLERLAAAPGSFAYELRSFGRDGTQVSRYATTRQAGSEREAEDAAIDELLGQLLADQAALGRLAAAPASPAPRPREVEPRPPEPRPPAPQPLPAQSGSTFVLIVGVNAYHDQAIRPLRFAEPDAREVYSFFATEKRSPADPDRVRLLTGEGATRRAFLESIREHLAAKAIRPEDTAILYFAGHGFADASETYLALHDTELKSLPETAVAVSALKEAWSKVRAGRKVLLVDACHSGGLEGVRGIGGVSLAPRETGPSSASVTIAATGPNELSAENESLGHGVFTVALLKGLRGEADADGSGRVSARELGAYLVREVPSLAALVNGKQTPVVSGAEQGDAVLLTR